MNHTELILICALSIFGIIHFFMIIPGFRVLFNFNTLYSVLATLSLFVLPVLVTWGFDEIFSDWGFFFIFPFLLLYVPFTIFYVPFFLGIGTIGAIKGRGWSPLIAIPLLFACPLILLILLGSKFFLR